MINFIMSDMDMVRARIKKPAITAIIVMILFLILETVNHNLVHFLTKELIEGIGGCYMFGGLWYGRNLVFQIGQRPVNVYDEYEEERPEHINVTVFRLGLAVAVGATVGAVFFGIDTLRIVIYKIKIIAEAKKA